ncbi:MULTISPECIES: hypothetical protein [unclassified Oceanispirochaeta]|uniref:hypothetical protein n=1 Tax=unclassified Oceanispirochaeta TaxID=2635722 RepID=UPI000E095723|nr:MULTISPECIES: hypothetical protein [unclassified Oceanispirochaeta]MBF9017197.1 hypothetical protein [Oceanispirochaeta sp. M2]NPD73646.1 hypothetical protein [Oceanispirochaeta sp. M1]RDG30576.1 hypothetical protein DV872_16260 [Oceanispirochaeta sp. M1]
MKKRKHFLTWLITIMFLLLMIWTLMASIWGVGQDYTIPAWLKAGFMGLTVLIIVPIMIMMIVTAVHRKREIDEEDEDDLSQY